MLDNHAGVSAELYALGALNELERRRIERHAATCDECSRRVGEAEATVLHLIESRDMPLGAFQPDRRIRFGPAPLAARAWIASIAAAFLIGLLPWGVASLRGPATNDAALQQQLATSAMLAGHFVHVPFQPRVPGAPAAKVIYAREGGWFYVIVAPGPAPLDVVVVAHGKRTTVGAVSVAQTVRSVFVNQPTPIEMVELCERGVPIAVAHIAYVQQRKP